MCRFRHYHPWVYSFNGQPSSINHKTSIWLHQKIRYIARSTVASSAANGPKTTLPAHLDIPVRKPNQVALSHYYSVGKSYLEFYKTGIKNIYYNYKASQLVQKLIDSKYDGDVSSAIRARAITRSDFQLLTRNWHDLKRVPLFGLTIAFFGEFTPLVAIAFGNIVPLTCRIPAQITKEREKIEEMRHRAFQKIAANAPDQEELADLHCKQLALICESLRLTSRIWNLLGGPPSIVMKRKVQKRLEYLTQDDDLIEFAGGVGEMNSEEVIMALIQRGIDVLRRDESLLRSDLKSWLLSRRRVSIIRLLLTRYFNIPKSTLNQ